MNQLQEKLLFLCQFGNKETVETFINEQKEKLNINIPNYFGQTPLILSIFHQKFEILNILLNNNGIDLGKRTFLEGKTAIMYAVEKGNLNIVKLLLKKNCNIEIQDSKGRSVLIYAILSKNVDIFLEILHQSKDLVNQIDKEGKNSLHYALGNHFYQDAKIFIDELIFKHAILIKDSYGKYPFDYYSENDKSKLFEQTTLKLPQY